MNNLSHYAVPLLLTLLPAAPLTTPPPATPNLEALPATVIADRAKPATVLIVTRTILKGACPKVEIDTAKLRSALLEMVADGTVRPSMTSRDTLVAVINKIMESPGDYFKPGDESRPIDTQLTSTGSGVLITPDGYLLTNAHVVTPSRQEIADAFVEGLTDWVKDDLADVQREISELLPGKELVNEAKERYAKALATFYMTNMNIQTQEDKIYALLGSARTIQNIETSGKPCDIKAVGKAIPGKDVAILKIAGTNYATLPLVLNEEAGGVRTGEQLHALGFPAIAAFSTPANATESTMTNGQVTALKSMPGGWRVIQTSVDLLPGNSGGPVLNDKGEVVGLATFSALDPATNRPLPGFNYVVPTDVVREFLREANVTPAESPFTRKYNQALNEFKNRYYSSALKLFREAAEESPDVSYVREYISRCRREIENGRDQTWKKSLWIGWLAGGLGMVSLLVLFVAKSRAIRS